MSNPLDPNTPAQQPSNPAAQSASQAAAPVNQAAPPAATVQAPQPPAKQSSAGTWVGLGLVVAGFVLALIPLIGVIGWPLMLAGLVMGIIGAAKKWQPMWANIVNIALGFVGPGLAIVLVTGVLATGAAVTAPTDSGNSGASQSSESTETSKAEAPEEGSVAADSEYAVTIDGSRLSTDYEGKQALVVDYSFTNNSGKAISFMIATSAKAFQNGVELNSAIGADTDAMSLLNDVKPGATIQVQQAYVLSDSSDVTVEVTKLISFKEVMLATQVISVA